LSMPKLYLKEYARVLAGRKVFIACREGILRDHLPDIITDIKFLVRHGALTVLLHNIPNRFSNQKMITQLAQRLPATDMVRVSPEMDFYDAVLNHRQSMFKVIFLERRYLIDRQGNKINAVTTTRVRESLADFGNLIANVNFKGAMACICRKIEAGQCDRVHILAAGKHVIKHELFTVEGAGTLIANNFQENFRQVQTDEEVAIVQRILKMYKRSGFLKPRTKAYLKKNQHRFYVTAIDGIVVGCVEQKIIDENTVEIGRIGHIHALSQPAGGGAYGKILSWGLMKLTRVHALYLPDQQPPSGSALYTSARFRPGEPAGIPGAAGHEP
jgi:amino-acid N-acetyltransferase